MKKYLIYLSVGFNVLILGCIVSYEAHEYLPTSPEIKAAREARWQAQERYVSSVEKRSGITFTAPQRVMVGRQYRDNPSDEWALPRQVCPGLYVEDSRVTAQ